MSRSRQWRGTVSDACNWHQTQALEATIYLLRQTGPTGFLLKEEGETKTVKVYLGDLHTCTCAVFKKERDLCKHICWLLLRKFRLSPNDPLSWQLGLVEREVNEILQGRNTAAQPRSQSHRNSQKANENNEESIDGRRVVKQREISEDDVCPICQDELLSKKLAVTYCRFGCGNTIHMKCMNVWAEHQQKTSQDKSIKCPMCREDFGTLESLKTESRNAGMQKSAPHGIRLDRHLGIACSHCSKAPIEGKCYKCVVCPHFFLCQRCFNFPIHTNHSFQFRQKRNQRWRSATRTLGASLPSALVQDLQQRDLSQDDYDSLLLLDRNTDGDLSTLTEENLHRLPMERIRERSSLLSPGAQCRVCLRGFLVGQFVRRLPCQHKFHKECIDNWLLHSHPTCPIDGLVALRPEHQQQSSVVSAPPQMAQGLTDTQTSAGLAINAMGIPVAANRLHQTTEGSNPSLRRPPRIPLQPLPTTPQGLEVNGMAVAAGDMEDDGVSNSGNHRLISREREETVPGERLLRQARLHRQRINQHLNTITNGRICSSDRNQRTVTLGDLIQCQPGLLSADDGESVTPLDVENDALGPTSISRHNSAGSIMSIGSDTTGLSNDVMRRHTRRHVRSQGGSSLRERISSAERSIPSIQTATQNLRDLYLGNDPSGQPPINGESSNKVDTRMARQRRARPTRLYQKASFGKSPNSIPRQTSANVQESNSAEFSLYGFAVDN